MLILSFFAIAAFAQACVTALANLTQQSIKEGAVKKMFSKDEILRFFEMHGEVMTGKKCNWQTKVLIAKFD